MRFTGQQLAAILKLSISMMCADGEVKDEEKSVIFNEMRRFGVESEDFGNLIEIADKMDGSEAVRIVSAMDVEQKRYAGSVLGVMMAIDGNIDDSELNLWRTVCTLCDCPTMNIEEAFKYLDNM